MSSSPLLAILGGTFDPVHYGHLRPAEDVRRALGLDAVRLIPAGDPPHRAAPVVTAAHRLAMLELARQEFPRLAVDAREIGRAGKSYTVDTLEELRREFPGRPLALILGADQFRALPTWHRWREVFDLAHVIVIERPGESLEELAQPLRDEWTARATEDSRRLDSAPAGAIYRQAISPQPISSTAIRQALALGPEGIVRVRGLVPAAVLAYIDRNQLYRSRERS